MATDNLHKKMALDDKFKDTVGKLQSIIDKLADMPDEFFDVGQFPTESQVLQLTSAGEDLTAISQRLSGLRKK